MFLFDWSALMTPKRPLWTTCVYSFVIRILLDSLAPKFQHSLSAVTLDMYLGG